jgi:hypothetical protein
VNQQIDFMATEIFNFLKRLCDESLRLSAALVFKRQPTQLWIICLYGSLIELASSIVLLVERSHWTAVGPVFRSLLETFVDLKNLLDDHQYANFMEAEHAKQTIRMLQSAFNGTNPFLSHISESGRLKDELTEQEKKLSGLIKAGFRPLSVHARFSRAGMENEYSSIYNFVSREAHSGIGALIQRHFELENGHYAIVFLQERPLEENVNYVSHTAELVLHAGTSVHRYFSSDQQPIFVELAKQFEKLLQKYEKS